MNLDVAIVPHEQLSSVVYGLLKYIKKSEMWSGGRATVSDILTFIFTNQMLLWIVYEQGTKNGFGFVITEVKQYPRAKWLVIQYTAGEPWHMQFIENKMWEKLENFAKDAGCVGIEFFGRRGWRTQARKHGFDMRQLIYEKYL